MPIRSPATPAANSWTAYSAGKTKAVMMGHALGNPFDLAANLAFCRKYDFWLVEDNCDALGCSYSMPRQLAESLGFSENSPGLDEGPDRVTRWTGTWGDISTQSFYPPHHLTMGEGGAVNIVHDQKLKVIAESFRDWGRDCWCPSGIDNTCNKRFGWQLGELPEGYDHKYIYSHLGFNLKPLDPQAAIGRVQLRQDTPDAIRVVGEMEGSDKIMTSTLFLGTFPGLTQEMLGQEAHLIQDFCLN